MDWSSNIGEHAIDIVVFNSSNAPLSIFVLGEMILLFVELVTEFSINYMIV